MGWNNGGEWEKKKPTQRQVDYLNDNGLSIPPTRRAANDKIYKHLLKLKRQKAGETEEDKKDGMDQG